MPIPIIADAHSSATLAAWATFALLVVAALGAGIHMIRAGALRREQVRPWVTVGVDEHDPKMLTITNVGSTGAHDVVVRPVGDPKSGPLGARTWNDAPLLGDGIPILPPGATMRAPLDALPSMGLPMKRRFEVEYRGRGRDAYRDTYVLSLNPHSDMETTDTAPPSGVASRPVLPSGNGERRTSASRRREGLGRGLGDLLGLDDRPMVVVTIEEPRADRASS